MSILCNHHIGMLNTGTAFTLCVQQDWVCGKMQVLHFYKKISEWGLGGDWHSDAYSRMLRCLPAAVAMLSALHCILSAVKCGVPSLWMAVKAAASQVLLINKQGAPLQLSGENSVRMLGERPARTTNTHKVKRGQ